MSAALITRKTADLLGNAASAVFSEDGAYRYLLTRTWGRPPFATWVMLNPSTASETVNDPTITRCIGFSRRWGCGGLAVVNLYGLRSTDPAALASHPDPVGPDNDRVIEENCSAGGPAIAAWGAGALPGDRARFVAAIFARLGRPMLCLGVTKGGHPRHPLYVRGDETPVSFEPPGRPS